MRDRLLERKRQLEEQKKRESLHPCRRRCCSPEDKENGGRGRSRSLPRCRRRARERAEEEEREPTTTESGRRTLRKSKRAEVSGRTNGEDEESEGGVGFVG